MESRQAGLRTGRWPRILALLLLSPLGVVAQTTGPAPFRLAGRVLDGATDAPIDGATVRLEELGLSTVTDAEGFFALEGVTAGLHTFVTSHELFHENREASTVGPGAVLFVRLLARTVPNAVASAAQRLLELEPGAKLRVRLDGGSRDLVAVLRELRTDTLLLGYPLSSPGSVMPLAVSTIDKLELSVGQRSLVPIGASAGALLGALAVAGYNSLLASQCVLDCPEGRTPVLIGFGVGALVGGVGFSFIGADRWVEIPLAR